MPSGETGEALQQACNAYERETFVGMDQHCGQAVTSALRHSEFSHCAGSINSTRASTEVVVTSSPTSATRRSFGRFLG